MLALALVLATAPEAAQSTPPATREQAIENVAKGNVEARRQAVAESSLWQVWSRSGDPQIDALFRLGLEQMREGAAPAAIQTFTSIIEKKPEFAEGWNKRATIYYLVGEYDKSLRDCDEVIKRNPQHWGALAGYGQIYLALDKPDLALDYFQRALKVNPNLRSVEAAVAELKRLVIEKRKGTI